MTKKDQNLIVTAINTMAKYGWLSRDEDNLIENIALNISSVLQAAHPELEWDGFVERCLAKEVK